MVSVCGKLDQIMKWTRGKPDEKKFYQPVGTLANDTASACGSPAERWGISAWARRWRIWYQRVGTLTKDRIEACGNHFDRYGISVWENLKKDISQRVGNLVKYHRSLSQDQEVLILEYLMTRCVVSLWNLQHFLLDIASYEYDCFSR